MLNILVCSINRWKNMRAVLRGGKVIQPDSFFEGADKRTEMLDLQVPGPDVVSVLRRELKKQHYRVRFETTGNVVYAAADKNRFFGLATYASHLSLILFVLAYILGNSLGFRNDSFIVTEGETREVGNNTGLSLNLVSFVDEYYADNTPKDYRSQVVLLKNGENVRQATVRVNHPLLYRGVRFYQSFYGKAVKLQLKQNDAVIFQGNIALNQVSANRGYQRYFGSVDLPQSGISVFVFSAAINASDPVIAQGQLALEVQKDGEQVGIDLLQKGIGVNIAGIESTYIEDLKFSGFQVSHDPGNTLIWIASVLFIAGVVLVLYFVHSQMWVSVRLLPSGKSRILARSMTRGHNQADDLKKLVIGIQKGLFKNHEI